MNATSNGRVIRIALAGSLAVHFIVALLVHPRPVHAEPPQEAQRTTIVHLIPPKPTPPPRKLLQPQKPRVQRNAQTVHPIAHPPRLSTQHARGVAIAIPTGAPDPIEPGVVNGDGTATDSPAPTPTPKPSCSAPDVPARTTFVQSPVVPDDVSENGVTAKIRVDLDSNGTVTGVSVYESAGSMPLDRAALAAARQSRYAPEERDCKNIAGSYLFTVDFSGTM